MERDERRRAAEPRPIQFGPFRFARDSRQLRRGEVRLHLPPRAAAVLDELLTAPGEVLSKDHLLDNVWNGNAGTDEALMQAISIVRQALGDDARAPRYIETVAREGYRFIGEIGDEPAGVDGDDVAAVGPGAKHDVQTLIAASQAETLRVRPLPRTLLAPGVALFGVAVMVGLAWSTGAPWAAGGASRVTRFTIRPPEGVTLDSPAVGAGLAISPDGRFIAFVGDRGGERAIYLRDAERFEAEPVAIVGSSTELRGAGSPFFTRDLGWIGFHQGTGFWKIPRTGGAPIRLREFAHPQGAILLPDGDLVHRWDFALWRVPAEGGEPTRIGTGNFLWPDLLPGGRFLVANWLQHGTESADDGRIYVIDLATNEQRELPFRGSAPRWATSGHLLFARRGALHAVSFDLETATPLGAPVKVLDGVATDDDHATPSYAISADGTLVYQPAVGPTVYRVVKMGLDGSTAELIAGERPFSGVRISPDGRWLALTSGRVSGNLWLYDLQRGTLRRMQPPANEFLPVWTPGSREIYHLAWRADGSRTIERLEVTRSGSGRTLFEAPSSYPISRYAGLWSVHPSGDVVLYGQITRGTTAWDVWAFEPDSGRAPYPLLATGADEWYAEFSPDGRWIAYVSNETDREEVYLTDYPALERRLQLSTSGGFMPRWAPDMKTVYYQEGPRIMRVPMAFDPDPRPAPPEPLADAGLGPPMGTGFDVAPDGLHLYVAAPLRQAPRNELAVVVGWFEELRRLAPR